MTEYEIKRLCDRIKELVRENEELENKIADIKANCDLAIEGRDIKIKELETENAELKEKLNFSTQYYQGEKAKDQLTKAIEIISAFVEWANWEGGKCPSFKSIQDKAEQFLKEIEK